MNILLVFAWVWAAFIAMSFWESYVEGRNAFDKGKLGWKVRVGKHFVFTAYHFNLFFVMVPLFLSLPLIIFGWDTRLFGVLLSAYFSGIVIEDFFWYVVNPVVKLKEWGPKFASYYPWIGVGKFRLPVLYLVGILLSFASWLFLWQ